MTTKLTLSIDSKVVKGAKRYSKTKGKSISRLVEEYLGNISTAPKKLKKGSAVKELSGIMGKAPADFDYKAELMEILEEKYLKP
jgi:hypothetical protein